MASVIQTSDDNFTLKDLAIKSRRLDDGYTVIKCRNSASRQGIMDELIKLGYQFTGAVVPFELRPYIFLYNGRTDFFTHTDDNSRNYYLSENIWWLS
jgi:hypothetical protein